MSKDNRALYEQVDVVAKYSANTTRLRSLNNAEKFFIDCFDVKNKHVLVIGCGAGRVPANLLLYGNRVLGVDRSEAMIKAARNNFPQALFPGLSFERHDAVDLSNITEQHFDTVFFPMNSIDYINPHHLRLKALREAGGRVAPGGLLAVTSHNNHAYLLSPRVHYHDRKLRNFFKPFCFDQEHVIGGGYIYKGTPRQVIKEVIGETRFSFEGFTADARNKYERLLMRKLWVAQWFFSYLLYVFKKSL